MALFNPGDEVLLFEPFYGYHWNTLIPAGGPGSSFARAPGRELDFDRLQIPSPQNAGIVINTPCNPSGKVFTRKELEGIAALAEQHDLFVITDEIYEYFLCGDAEHVSFALLPNMAERTITISGFSKTFSVTGWRLGYSAADAESGLRQSAIFTIMVYVCAPSPFQHGAAAGLENLRMISIANWPGDYEQKRDQLVDALTAAGLTPSIPDGAYYILADASRVPGRTARQKARNLLARCGVAAVAGTAFFSTGRGENLLRFCYAKRSEPLAEACERLRNLSW